MKKLVLFPAFILAVVMSFAQPAVNSYYTNAAGDAWNAGGYNMGPPLMTDADFRSALSAMDRQPFDDDKIRIADQVLRGRYASSAQVRDMVQELTFESSKLQFAKSAYARVYDQQNYYVVSTAFTFSSSMNELADYTASAGFSNSGVYLGSYGGSNGGGHCGNGGSGSGSGHGHGHGNGHGHGHGQGHTCTSSCNHGGSVGVNGYYGGSVTTTTNVSGCGNGMVYSGQISTGTIVPVAPAMPMCGMCSGYHDMTFICDREFMSISDAIDHRTFESDKLCMAKQAIGTRFINAVQVRSIMGLFTFESTKLDFAKWAYRHCWDQQNYYVVNDAFTFSSSIRELDDFIRFG